MAGIQSKVEGSYAVPLPQTKRVSSLGLLAFQEFRKSFVDEGFQRSAVIDGVLFRLFMKGVFDVDLCEHSFVLVFRV
jgi:hypothetical protein